MNPIRALRFLAVFAMTFVGLASPGYAAVNVFFSAGNGCSGAANALYSPGGSPVQVSLCMTTTAPTATCGHTVVLQSAVGEGGKFTVVDPVTLGGNYSDPNSIPTPTPLAINNPPTVADFGGTSSASVPAAANQVLATFNLLPAASATNASYVISLAPVSIVALDADGTCGQTAVPLEAAISASFTLNKNPAPAFTSAAAVTFAANTFNTFTVAATGTPAPTLSVSPAPPAGVSFTPATGVLSGTPTANGTFPLTFTASNASGTVTQSFVLTVSGLASQTINFTNPGQQTFGSNTIALSATASSGLAVAFTTGTPTVCTVSGANVTMLTLGTCTINANQPGNATYAAAPTVAQSFAIVGGVPGAPTIGVGTAGNAQATVSFTAPASTGGSPITLYTATCNGISATANSSPITVTGLSNGTTYSCTVTATNSLGPGPASAAVSVTPSNAAPLALLAVESRKVHGALGTFPLPITLGVPIGGAVTVESRFIGTGHVIAFRFSEAITSAGTVTAVDGASAPIANSVSTSGSEVLVTLTGLADKSRASITLANVNGSGAGTTFNATMGFLVGDQNGSRAVDGADISVIRARTGQATNTTNFRGDFNSSGAIDAGDISTVRARSGNTLP
ncbi:MAG TPA: hypothetical protein VFV17_05555 [Usitatibacteraceae bacterium]|nr:hypothetical protein [Usitatibacteraceae bacterium]